MMNKITLSMVLVLGSTPVLAQEFGIDARHSPPTPAPPPIGSTPAPPVASTGFLSGYHLTFDDEFSSTFVPQELGGTVWRETIFNGTHTYGGENYGSSDGGLTAYLKAGGKNPISIGGGVLSITATPNSAGSTGAYTTALIDNRYAFNQVYGYFEMRAQFPAGAGFWPGFWTLPSTDNYNGEPEVDVVEAFGSAYNGGGSNEIHYNLHSYTNPNTTGNWVKVNGNIWTAYHSYGVMYNSATITYYFDGAPVASLPTSTDLKTGGEYLLASLLTGSPGDWPGPMAGETGTLKIDYIRAFSSSASIPAVALQPFSSPDGGGETLYGATSK
jgi:beta-glucanase (GH16 family)